MISREDELYLLHHGEDDKGGTRSDSEKSSGDAPWHFDKTLVGNLRWPFLVLSMLLAAVIVAPIISSSLHGSTENDPAFDPISRTLIVAIIFSSAWLIIALIRLFENALLNRYYVEEGTGDATNIKERKVHTQVKVLSKTLGLFIIVIAIAATLMTFETVRNVGNSILASAGVASLIIGIAARQPLENIFASLQIGLTQPVRINDVVIIDGEWGRIEEIRTTFIVVKIWDQRRLIVPLSRFISQSFQNWTRKSSELLGSFFIWVDYATPVDDLREELKRSVTKSKYWDGRACSLVVIDFTEYAMKLRAVVSAKNSGDSFELQCYCREEMAIYMRKKYPQYLPRTRRNAHEA